MSVTAVVLASVGWLASPLQGVAAAEPPALLSGIQDEGGAGFPREPLVPLVDDRAPHLAPRQLRSLSKKESWLLEKTVRPDVRVTRDELRVAPIALRSKRRPVPATEATRLPPVGARIEPVTTLFNVWTKESLPILPGRAIEDRFHMFLRDHYTNQATEMDTRLIDVLMRVAQKFRTARIEVVSGYRSPKYNLMLRKKGHEVARKSEHVEGNAVDFRIRGVPTQSLLRFVRSLRRGGVGYYPKSQFVHSDTGRVRFWKGT